MEIGLNLSDFYKMTLRQFSYCIDGYVARQKNKMDIIAMQAIMIGACNRSKKPIKRIDQLIGRSAKSFSAPPPAETRKDWKQNEAPMPMSEIYKLPRGEQKEALAKWHKMVSEDFERVRKSPTYTKSTFSEDSARSLGLT